jgi:hypothetical protein
MEISAIAVRPEAPGGAATARLSRSLWHERHLLGMKCRFCMYTRTIRLHRSMPGWASASAASSGCPCGAGLRRPDRMSAIARFVLRETSAAVGLLFRCFSYMSTQPNEIILETPKIKTETLPRVWIPMPTGSPYCWPALLRRLRGRTSFQTLRPKSRVRPGRQDRGAAGMPGCVNSVRLVRFILHPCLIRNKINFPGLATIVRE